MDKRCNMISSDKDIFFFLSFDMFSSRESRESRENASLHSRLPAGWHIRAIAMYTSRDSRDSREVSLPKTALCKIVHAYNRIGRRLRNAF